MRITKRLDRSQRGEGTHCFLERRYTHLRAEDLVKEDGVARGRYTLSAVA